MQLPIHASSARSGSDSWNGSLGKHNMKLVPKGWDEYNPVLVVIGAGFVAVGSYVLLIMPGPSIVWLVRGPIAMFVAVGVLIIARQFQRRWRETIVLASLVIFLVGSYLTKSHVMSGLAGAAVLGFFIWSWVRDRKAN